MMDATVHKTKNPAAIFGAGLQCLGLMRYDDIHAIGDKYKLHFNNCQESLRIATNDFREYLMKSDDQLRKI